jgi:hypothetical protein
MNMLTFLLLIILIIVIVYVILYTANQIYLNNVVIPNLDKVKIDSLALKEFTDFMNENPKLKAYEEYESGISNIITHPDGYFRTELTEPEHSCTAHMAEKNNWLIDIPIVRNWITEEYNEARWKNLV